MSAQEHNSVVMFADVSGSAALFERLGDNEAVRAVDRCLKRMKRSIEGYRGRTIQIVGDELLAIFESSEDACQAAIDMQLRIGDLPPVSGLKLTIRIGLHFGPVIEDENGPHGPVVDSAARIAGIARRDQILGSSALVATLPNDGSVTFKPMPELGSIHEKGKDQAIFELHWVGHHQATSTNIGLHSQDPLSTPPSERLCVRYHGKAFLLDEKTPVLTLGRDLGNKLIIEDRKASRQHSRIERRNDGFYLVDTSTNGSFVTLAGRQEVLVRRHELLLEGSGRICFGCSINEATADGADFEHL